MGDMSTGPDLWRFLSFVWNILVMEFFFYYTWVSWVGTGARELQRPDFREEAGWWPLPAVLFHDVT